MSLEGAVEPRGGAREAEARHAAASLGFPGPVPLQPLDERPLISVLIANKDYGRFLPQALDGLLAQTYERWEAIVCDDGSTDESGEILRAYAMRDPRISFVSHRRTRGQGAAFNTAFRACRGELVCLLDADDIFRPRKLQVVVEVMRRSGAGAVVHPLMMIDVKGREIQRIPGFTRFERGWIADRVVRRGGRWRWVPTSGIAIRRDIAELTFPMPEQGYVSSADTFLLMLAPLLTAIDVADVILADYRRHDSNQFARVGLDVSRVPRTRGNLAFSIDSVNKRLDDLARSGPRLRIQDNLQARELGFQQALLNDAAPRGELLVLYRELAAGLARDDLYGDLQKHWAHAMYLVAIALPARVRGRWLGASISASRPKELLRRAWGLVGGA